MPACCDTACFPMPEGTIKRFSGHHCGIPSNHHSQGITKHNMDSASFQSEANDLSYRVPRATPDIDGLCHGYELRRHKHEQHANEGSLRCREDWTRYIGPIERWGSCNPYDGNFAAVVLPMCKPERLALASYIFECEDFGRCASLPEPKLTFL